MAERKIKRALISVYDKSGIVDFARALVGEFGVEIISTGGTAKLLQEHDIPVTLVEQVTGFPEMMDGRVKTLHPKIHAAILADRDNPEHMRQLAEQGIQPIDMVVVNLYPFEETIKKPGCTFEQAIEMIDIGGPCMLRAAAKNHKHVLVVRCDPAFYDNVIYQLHSKLELDERDLYESGAWGAFIDTATYDGQVSAWLDDSLPNLMARISFLKLFNRDRLRYGENPGQSAELVDHFVRKWEEAGLICSDADDEVTRMSFNNYADGHAALELCKELTRELTMCGTGFQPVIPSADAPASSRWPSIEGDHVSRRHLPHLQTTNRSYFVTFRTKDRTLSPSSKDIVLESCRHWHGERMTLHAAVVMPDHVHLLLTPFETESGASVALGEILHSIKSFSANEVNKQERRTGPLWLDERWDRMVRTEKEFIETWEYIETNPDRAKLGDNYKWFWSSATGFEEAGVVRRKNGGEGSSGGLDRESAHRLEAGAARVESDHRLEAGATQTNTKQDRAAFGCVFIKHTNACGACVADDPMEAYRQAYLGDPNAAMGGILACNFDIKADFAKTVMETYGRFGKDAGAGGFFLEVWIAPTFENGVAEIIQKAKKWGERVRLLTVGDMTVPPDAEELEYKSIAGGMLVQTRDLVGLNENQWKVATKRKPTDEEMADLRLAWLVCKHTKSNAITICKDNMLIGNGAGQMSRVMSCRIAVWLAEENGHQAKLAGSVAASDAFFPFPDGPLLLMDAGVKAIIQPGGSKRDGETIAACDERDVAMIVTGTRHFKH